MRGDSYSLNPVMRDMPEHQTFIEAIKDKTGAYAIHGLAPALAHKYADMMRAVVQMSSIPFDRDATCAKAVKNSGSKRSGSKINRLP